MAKSRFVILSLCFLLFFSCNKELKLPDVATEKKLSILGELTAGDTTYLRAGQSIPLTASSSRRFETLEGINIQLEDDAGSIIPLNSYVDEYAPLLSTLPFSSLTRIKEATTYNIRATHAALGTATAIVPIPTAFKATTKNFTNTVYAQDSAIKVDIEIEDPSASQNYYFIEAVKQLVSIHGDFKYQGNWISIVNNQQIYNQQKASGTLETRFDTVIYKNYVRALMYSDDDNIEGSITNRTFEPHRRILIRDNSFNGKTYKTTVYISRNYSDSLYNTQKGRLLLQVKSVSADYFRYIKNYEEQTDQGDLTNLSQPLKIEGNIINGLGIIGGVYKNEFIVNYDTWPF